MKILVTGANGQVGAELVKRGKEGTSSQNIVVVALSRSDLDISNYSDVDTTLCSIKPDVVINAAAYTAVDKAEEESEQAYNINRDGPANLASTCKKLNIPLIHISTDYVFDGHKKTPYEESDQPNPSGVYGKSKFAGERAIADILTQYYIVRVAWVFGASGNNFVKTMLRLGKEKDEIGVVADQRGGPTWARDIAKLLLALASRCQHEPIPWGIYHYTGDPVTTWFDFANDIFDTAIALRLLDKKPRITAISSEQYPTLAKRPSNSVLCCNKLKQAMIITQPNWQQGLQTVLGEFK